MKVNTNITDLSLELLCQILDYLPLREVLSVAMLCKKMSTAVDMHLRLCKSIDFCQDAVCGYMPSSITDDHLLCLLKKCPNLEIVYGLHPVKIERRRLRKRSALTIPGTIEALSLCFNLKAIETSDIKLLEAIMQHLSQLEIIGHFQNRDGTFPPQASQRLKLQPYPRVSSLHLIGVEVPELTAMPHLQHLHLQCVRFTKLQPFRAFLAQNLKSFAMKHCIGPAVPQRYLSLIIALSSSPNLSRLELVRVPLLNGLFQRAVEDSYRHNGFVNLRTLVIAGCKGILEADLGYLMIVASKNLETLYVQPSLTKDSLFVSLSYAQCSFPKLQNLHLGFIDNLKSSGEWTNDALLSLGLAEVPDTPSSITDSGMKVISQLFLNIKTLSVSNCPHLMLMYQWMPAEDQEAWSKLTDLTLQKCHCLQLSSFALFLSFLQNIQVVILNDMFREPPKGCSHVGLSAGTGLGMSSAVVSNQDEHIAVQGHQQDFEQQGDDENEENEREFVDIENDDNPEPQFMVLQQNFFDGEDDDGVEGDDIMEESQDLEQEHNGQHNGVENLDDSPNNEHAMDTINSDCNSSKPSSIDKIVNDPLTSSVSNDQSESRNCSRYNLRQKYKKSSKSVYVSNVSSNLNKAKKTLNSEKISSDDKVLVMPEVMDSKHIREYDPHKPSTSKAGRHLDYYVTYGTKTYNLSDSESDSDYTYSLNSKKSKKSSSKQSFSKKVKKQKLTDLAKNNLSSEANSSSFKNENNENPTTNKNYTYPNKSSEFHTSDSDIHSKSSNLSSAKKYELARTCKVIVTRYEEERLFSEPSNNYEKKSNIKSDPEMNSSSTIETPTPAEIDHLNFNLKHRISSVSVFDSMPEELGVGSSNNNEEKLTQVPIIIKCKSKFSMGSVHKGSEEINSSVTDEHLLKYSSCYVSLEKLNIETHSTKINNNCKNKTLSENKILKDTNKNSPKSISSSDCAHGIESKAKGDLTRADRHLENITDASVVEMEDAIAYNPIKNRDSKSLSDFEVTNDAQTCKHEDAIHSNCSEVSRFSPEEINNFCVSSNKELFPDDSFNNSSKEIKPKVNTISKATRLKVNKVIDDVIKKYCKDSENNENQILTTSHAKKHRVPKDNKHMELPLNNVNIETHSTKINNNCKNETLSENKILKDTNKNFPESISSSDCAHGIESKIKGDLTRGDRHLENITGASVVEMEDAIAYNPIKNRDSKSLSDFEVTNDAQTCKHEDVIHSNCSEVSRFSPEEINNFCVSSNKELFPNDSFNNSSKEIKPKVNTSSQDTKLGTKRKLDKSFNASQNLIQNEHNNNTQDRILKAKEVIEEVVNGWDKNSENNENQILKTTHAKKHRVPKNNKHMELPLNNAHMQPKVRQCHVLLTKIDKILTHTKIESENQDKTKDKSEHFGNSSFGMTSENTDSKHLNSFKTTNNMHINEAIIDGNYNSLDSTEENMNEILNPGHVNKNGALENNSISKWVEMPIENVSLLSEVKPCYVLVTKIDKTPLSTSLSSDEEDKASKNKTNTKEEIALNKNVSSKNENSIIHNPQPSTSNSGININNHSINSPRYNKKSKSLKCEISPVSSKNKHANSLHSNNDLRNKDSDSNKSKMQNIKNTSKNECCENNILEPDIEPSSSKKRLKKSLKDHNNEYKYYAVVPKTSDRSLEIVNSITGESHKIPRISISVSQSSSENCNTSEKVNDSQSELSSNYNPYLPSTSKDKSNMDYQSEMPYFQITNVKAASHKCLHINRQKQKKFKASKTYSNIEIKKEKGDYDNRDKCSENEKIEASQTCKFHNASAVSTASSEVIEKLKITNSDAALLTKRCHIGESTVSKINDSSPSQGNIIHCENCNRRRIDDKCTKQVKKHSKHRSTKSNSSDRYSPRKISKKNPAVPMVTLVSQGTQATSADIRRSVRRARRRTTGTHKAASSSYVSRKSSHRSKISAKMAHKIPVSTSTRPELHDKSTSTSDPLLEDDAVQTLQLASNTLLSFTVISCGISHLIIDRCPKLFHIEAQACRIFKKIQLKTCPALKKLNVSQCPKLSICAVVDPILSLTTNSYVLVSFEPCMQDYHPGEGEKAILSRALLNQSVLICHDFSEVSHDGMQAKFKEKLIIWLRYLSTLYFSLNYTEDKSKGKVQAFEIAQTFHYPWSHDVQKLFGRYAYPASSDFCIKMGRYQLVTNNPILRDLFETSQLDTGFPTINDCEAYRDNSLLSYEKIEKYIQMKKKFVAFYIPITESNKTNIYK